MAASWLLLLAPPLPPVLLASTSVLAPLSSTLAEIAQDAGAIEHAGRALVSCTTLATVAAGGVCTSVRSYPGLICRAMGERDEKLLPWRTPAGSVLRCAPLAVRYTPLAALPVGRLRA